MALLFKHPFSSVVSGPSGSGKSTFVLKFIQYAHQIVQPPPERIVWAYGVYQPLSEKMSNVFFIDGIPDIKDLRANDLLILDDLMSESNDERVSKLFTKHSHHLKISVMFITQNFFHKNLRNLTLNSHYLILFRNPRDAAQIAHLARQMYPGKSKFFLQAFSDATQNPFTYLVVDLKADTPDEQRLRSGIFPDEHNYCYVPK
jgi:hypothetical protein